MIVTINLATLLKWYFIGSIFSIIIMSLSKDILKTPKNYIISIIISWGSILIILGYLRDYVLRFSHKKLNTYNYLVIKYILNFNYRKSLVLKEYFLIKFRENYIKYNYYDDIDDYLAYKDEVCVRFIRRYNNRNKR